MDECPEKNKNQQVKKTKLKKNEKLNLNDNLYFIQKSRCILYFSIL